MEPPAYWSQLRERFLSLPDPRQLLYAMEFQDGTFLLSGGPEDESERGVLHSRFIALAERASMAADLAPNGSALDAWFRHLRGGPRYTPVRVTTEQDGTVSRDLESGWLDAICVSSAEACEVFETAAYAAQHRARATLPDSRTPLVRNLERLRLECGWTFEELANQAGIDRTRVFAHWKGSKARPATLKLYADAFARALKRPITAADLVS